MHNRLISTRSMPYCIAAFLSVLISFWISGRETVINPDAICYLQSAEAMKAGMHDAMNLCGQAKWPFYSILIAAFVHLTHFSYVSSAYLLNGFFSLITVLFFMGIIAFLTEKTSLEKNKTALISLGAAVILLSHQFNGVKTYIIRDHGFWAFYLGSILFLLHYFRSRQWYYAFAWSVLSLIATLFRIEGAIFLLIIPWMAWLDSDQTKIARLKSFLTLNAVTILVGILGCTFYQLYHPEVNARLTELEFQFLHGFILFKQNLQLKALGLTQSVLGESGARDATIVLFVTLIVWYFVNVITNLSLIYSALVGYAWHQKTPRMNRMTRLTLWSYVIINTLITAVFLGQYMFLSKRYLIALSLVLMLWVPFALYSLVEQWKVRKWPLLLAAFFIFITSLGGLFDFGYSKSYISEAGQWLSENVPEKAVLYSNDLQVMYYSHHFGNQIFSQFQSNTDWHGFSNQQWKKYDYIALRVDQKELNSVAGNLSNIKFAPIKVFQNKRGDQVRIYRRVL